MRASLLTATAAAAAVQTLSRFRRRRVKQRAFFAEREGRLLTDCVVFAASAVRDWAQKLSSASWEGVEAAAHASSTLKKEWPFLWGLIAGALGFLVRAFVRRKGKQTRRQGSAVRNRSPLFWGVCSSAQLLSRLLFGRFFLFGFGGKAFQKRKEATALNAAAAQHLLEHPQMKNLFQQVKKLSMGSSPPSKGGGAQRVRRDTRIAKVSLLPSVSCPSAGPPQSRVSRGFGFSCFAESSFSGRSASPSSSRRWYGSGEIFYASASPLSRNNSFALSLLESPFSPRSVFFPFGCTYTQVVFRSRTCDLCIPSWRSCSNP